MANKGTKDWWQEQVEAAEARIAELEAQLEAKDAGADTSAPSPAGAPLSAVRYSCAASCHGPEGVVRVGERFTVLDPPGWLLFGTHGCWEWTSLAEAAAAPRQHRLAGGKLVGAGG